MNNVKKHPVGRDAFCYGAGRLGGLGRLRRHTSDFFALGSFLTALL
ncbi:hypothetical protein [Bacillus sp. FJAT-27264]|nr:hypothetical protein [Bacillus sp. FJAT-27264]